MITLPTRRGALVGPLVVCGITAEKKVVAELKKIGVRDSKLLFPKRREELYGKIKDIVQSKSGVSSIVPIFIQPCKIDESVNQSKRRNGNDNGNNGERDNLNILEAKTMAEIINMIGGNEVYLDALTSRPERFKRAVAGYLDDERSMNVKIIAENDADKKYPIVSAASIIAKVERDRVIEEIKKEAGFDFGVGYPHDKRTIEFVEMLIKTQKRLPSYVRKSWITTQMLQEKNWQRKIKDFIFRKEKKL